MHLLKRNVEHFFGVFWKSIVILKQMTIYSPTVRDGWQCKGISCSSIEVKRKKYLADSPILMPYFYWLWKMELKLEIDIKWLRKYLRDILHDSVARRLKKIILWYNLFIFCSFAIKFLYVNVLFQWTLQEEVLLRKQKYLLLCCGRKININWRFLDRFSFVSSDNIPFHLKVEFWLKRIANIFR